MVRVDYKQCCVDRPITDPYKGLLHLQSIIKNCFKLKLISEEGRVPLSCHRPSALAHVAVVAVVVVAAVVVVLVVVVAVAVVVVAAAADADADQLTPDAISITTQN